ncbi:MAG: TolC family protein [Myxococcota bacterium]
MPSRCRLFVLVAALTVGAPTAASATEPLSLDDVLQSVGQTHPAVEAADRGVDRARGKELAAKGGFDPELKITGKYAPVGYYRNGQIDVLARQATPAWGLGVFAGYRLGLGTYPTYRSGQQTLSGGEMRAGIDIPIWRDGPIDARRAKIQKTKILRGGAERARDATQLANERKAASTYWAWVAAGQRLRVARDLLAIAERRDAGLNEQAAAGAIERIKLVDNRRLVLDRMGKVVSAERDFEQASLALSLFLRDADANTVRVGEDRVPSAFPEPLRLDLAGDQAEVDAALQRRPDLAALDASRDAARVDVRLAKNQRAPSVNIQSYVAKDIGEGIEELQPVEWGAGLVFAMPLPLRQARGDFRAAKAGLASVDAQRRGLRDRIGAEVRSALVSLRASEQSITLARQQIDAADRLADAERTRFNEGASDLVTVNLRELAAADAANQEIDALAAYHRALADFLAASGRSPAS